MTTNSAPSSFSGQSRSAPRTATAATVPDFYSRGRFARFALDQSVRGGPVHHGKQEAGRGCAGCRIGRRTLKRGGCRVPYASVKDLPAPVHVHLPAHAQEIYRSAFNNAWIEYARSRSSAARADSPIASPGRPSSANTKSPATNGFRAKLASRGRSLRIDRLGPDRRTPAGLSPS